MSAIPLFTEPAGFIRLTPLNLDAKKAFNDVSLLMEDTNMPPALHHPRQFMTLEPWEVSTSSCEHSLALSEAGTGTESEGTEFEAPSISTELRYQGYYELSLSMRPNLPQVGWIIGKGRWNTQSRTFLPNGQVDLMLAPVTDLSYKYGVVGKHASIFFDANGSLFVRVLNTRRPDVQLGEEVFSSGARMITSTKQLLSFGNLSYMLSFTVEDQETFQSNLRIYFTSYLARPVPPPDMSATPTPWDVVIEGWVCKGTVGAGAYGVVRATKNKSTGEMAASKFVTRNTKNWPSVANEIRIFDQLPQHVRKLHNMLLMALTNSNWQCRLLRKCGVYYERGDRWLQGPSDEEDERYGSPARPETVLLVFQPYARLSLHDLLLSKISTNSCLILRQLLEGVHALHSAGFIHRDIKPANIGVVQFEGQNIDIVILDYGQTIAKRIWNTRDGHAGTSGYQAPEMLLENQEYGSSVDIWACAIVGLKLFAPGVKRWTDPHKDEIYIRNLIALMGEMDSGLPQHLLGQMLCWEPAKRISAADALLHPCFSSMLISPPAGDITDSTPPYPKRIRG